MSSPVIPSIADIRKSTDVLSPPDASATVVKVGDLAVKFGRRVTLSEAENLEWVSRNSKIPVPKLYATLTEPETNSTFIVMEFVEGVSLGAIWPSLTPLEKLDVGKKIQAALENLHELEAPGYLGSVGRQAFEDGVFWTPERDPAMSGPFDTEDELNEGMLRRMAELVPPSYLSLLRTLISTTLRGHKTKFTHGDLQPKNIIVRRTGAKDDGSGSFEIKILDWEISGWYPKYWEFCNATIAGRFKPDWLELVQQIMPIYHHEYLMMQVVRGILFY